MIIWQQKNLANLALMDTSMLCPPFFGHYSTPYKHSKCLRLQLEFGYTLEEWRPEAVSGFEFSADVDVPPIRPHPIDFQWDLGQGYKTATLHF